MAPNLGKPKGPTSPRKSSPSKKTTTRSLTYHTQRPPNKICSASTQAQNQMRGTSIHGPSPLGPIIRTKQAWQDWLELSVKLHNLPSNITTWDLWKRFEREGVIAFIEIYENRQGVRDGNGRIKFFQPPSVLPFWNGPVVLPSPDGGGASTIKVELEKAKRKFQIQSPIRKHVWYPERMALAPVSVDFGTMLDEATMMRMHNVPILPPIEQNPSKMLELRVDLLRNRITVDFWVKFIDETGTMTKTNHVPGAYDRVNRYMFQVPFNQLHKMNCVDVDKNYWALTFSLESPPAFYRKLLKEQESHKEKAVRWGEFDTWLRQTDIVYDPFALQTAVVSLNKEAPVIDIGRWTTYRLVFKKDPDELATFANIRSAFQDFNIDVTDSSDLRMVAGQPAAVWSLIDPVEASGSTNWLKNGQGADYPLSFEVRYQLEVCISQGYINEHNITQGFLEKLCQLESIKARNLLEYVAEQEKRRFDPMSIFDDTVAMQFSPSSKIPKYCAYFRKATITPSTILFSSPTVETTNRVIRQYSAFGDRFLRVQFTDEKAEGQINSCVDKERNDEIFTRVYRTLYNGIRIGDRHYEFLAFGNSQFRENGAYFFCPNEHVSCADIRRWMGNFEEIKVVAKYAARLGQCFSTTRAIHSVRPLIVKLEDVHRNGYCFTDGIGKISSLVARMITEDLNLPAGTTPPSAFQFRMGGCKGVLVASPDVKGQEIHIRKSQQKFTAIYNGLEIIRWSQYSAASLNRQTITILSSLGVEDEVFNRMLTEQLSNYQAAMDDKTLALDLLSRYVDDNHVTMTIATMVLNGFMAVNEPFMMSLLHLWRSWSIKLLKEKAKIIVEDGAFVLGVTDETGTLRGHRDRQTEPHTPASVNELPQIFLQVPARSQKGKYIVIVGICVLGRNPSLHPGDIRVVEAVDIPALHHLRDVVVFSQLGDRDVPSMCSGGDLDGDDFFVLWDKNLIPSEVNVQPMSYTAVKPQELDRPVEVQDMMKFFVRFMKNDSLPTIAHGHLAQSDYLDRGIKDPRCLELAELHSKAVDYVKSGEPAKAGKHLMPRQWPHFMEKRYKTKEQTYRSTKILGQLYDKVESVDFVPQYQAPFDRRILMAYKLDSEMLKTARQLKSKYDTAMRRILAQQEIKTEFEVWSTFILSKPRVGSDYKIQELMSHVAGALKARFRQNCIEAAGSEDFGKLGPFVAAMYRVTYEEMQIALSECRATKIIGGREVPKRRMEPKYMPLISFPWLFHEVLGRIATGLETQGDLSEVGLPYLTTKSIQKRTKKSGAGDGEDDYIETGEGIIHRGEQLDLFRPDDLDSDGDEVENPNATYNLGPTTRTGIEDEIRQSRLEGLIDPRDVGEMRGLYSSANSILLDFSTSEDLSDPREVASCSGGGLYRDCQKIPTKSQGSSFDLLEMVEGFSAAEDLDTSSSPDIGQVSPFTGFDSSDYDAASEAEEEPVVSLRFEDSTSKTLISLVSESMTTGEDKDEEGDSAEVPEAEEVTLGAIYESTVDMLSRIIDRRGKIVQEIQEGKMGESSGDAEDEEENVILGPIAELVTDRFARLSSGKETASEVEEDEEKEEEDEEEEAVVLGPIAESFTEKFARLSRS